MLCIDRRRCLKGQNTRKNNSRRAGRGEHLHELLDWKIWREKKKEKNAWTQFIIPCTCACKPPAVAPVTREMLSQFISAQSTCRTLTRGKRGAVQNSESQQHGINNNTVRGGGAARRSDRHRGAEEEDRNEGGITVYSSIV